MIAFVASDLIWSSRIKATADALGVGSKRIFNPDGLGALVDSGKLRLVLIDLESEDAEVIVDALRGRHATELSKAIPTLAWAPHVMVESMESARAAGVDRVLTRGAFSSKLEAIVAEVV